ncbi:sulfotransferase family protein [Jannaschia aquimarina]|uniref:Sulfotransferase family protein n=1 Tax=Jannaschia aquimarina TaxID=935700 RepID=A0A0D1EM88_9RHOB|nr:sulfotransferase family protein [Jannaschia aquimarina]KIT16805.1 hypothetical protein jaqu_13000 [Jannaschia aquimarina]SNT13833.1 hypothetical protein SAMN05421775_106147 [Jannaschia aquimarina]
MPPRLNIHIGLAKTGTTTIQAAMHGNRDRLAEHGVTYGFERMNHSVRLLVAFQSDPMGYPVVVNAGIDAADLPRLGESARQRLASEIARCKTPHYLISGEAASSFSLEDVKRIRALTDDLGVGDIRILCYVRDPISFARSIVQQRLKSGARLGELKYRRPGPAFRQRIEPWIETFGRDSLKIVAFETACRHRGGLPGSMLEAILGTEVTLPEIPEQKRQNASLCLEAALLLDALNARHPYLVDGGIGPNRSRGDANVLLRGIRGTPFHLGPDFDREVAADAADDVAWLREVSGQADLFGGYEAMTHRTYPEPAWSTETLEDVAATLFSQRAELTQPKG